MGLRFEEIGEKHLPTVQQIYNYYILHTTATFHSNPLSQEDMADLLLFECAKYRTFVAVENETVAGYVTLSQHKKREAYDSTAEVSVYLKPELTGRGLGKCCLGFIEEFARTYCFHVLIATICSDNIGSIKLFERSGYQKCAHFREVGKKFGQLHDVVAYQKILD